MRILAFVMFAVFMGAAPAAAWEEYSYPDQGVAIQFPAKPQQSKATYESSFVKDLPTTVYSVEDDHVLYKLSVVDLSKQPPAAGSNFVNETAYNMLRQGDVVFIDFPRLYTGPQSVFGITVVIDRKDGSRVRNSMYYTRGRLYIAGATVLPARGDKDMTTPARFDQTIRFPPDGRGSGL